MRILLAAFLIAAPAVPPQDPDATERLLRVVEKRHRETPDPTDARAAAARLGFDRAKIADFVAGLSWEPYAGILRDAGGTLMCGGGNSIDRALLLQAMLEAGGEKTRLMRVDVAEADGAKLLEAFRKRERKERPDRDLKPLAAEIGVDAASFEAMVSDRRRQEAALIAEIVDASKAEAARLLPLVGALAGRAATAPREHVWIQVLEKGTWIDLDPSPVEIPRKGARPLTPQEITAQRRSVTFRLLLNRKIGDKIEALPLLSVPVDLSAISWKAVDFIIQPPPGQLSHSSGLRKLDAKGLLAAFRGVKQYRPCLFVDGKSYGGIPFDLDGQTYDVDAGGRVGPAKGVGSAVGKAFGGAFGGGDEAAPKSTLESVVFEVALKEPGAPERIQRRTLVTAPKPGPRALPILRYSYLVESAPLPQGEWGRREIRALALNAPALQRLFKGQLEGVHFNLQADISPYLLLYGDLRRRILGRLSEGTAFVQDRPGLVADTGQVFLDEERGQVLYRQGIDILDNPGYFDGAAERTLTLGAAETALECLLIERLAAGQTRLSAWTQMERGRLQGGKAEVSEKDGRREVRWSADAWWSVDPAGGVCVGRVPSGAGQALVEKAIEVAGNLCKWADLIGFLGGTSNETGNQPEWADNTTKWYGRGCALVGGTNVRDEIMSKIEDMKKAAWKSAIAALGGG